MTLKLSSTKILSCIVSTFVLVLLGLLVYSIRLTNNQYQDYKLNLIRSSPYESQATITNKYALGGGFEIEYQFRGKPYGEVMKVKNDLFKQYKEGDKIPITLSRNHPSLVTLSSELKKYTQKYP